MPVYRYCIPRMLLPVPGLPLTRTVALFTIPPLRISSSPSTPVGTTSVIPVVESQYDRPLKEPTGSNLLLPNKINTVDPLGTVSRYIYTFRVVDVTVQMGVWRRTDRPTDSERCPGWVIRV